jgi:hypothetical protein
MDLDGRSHEDRRVISTARARVLLLATTAIFVAGCAVSLLAIPAATPSRSLGPGERWVPVANWDAGGGVRLLCAGGGFVADMRLHGSVDDPRLVWMTDAFGIRTELGWPVGYSARFTPALELLDDLGHVIAREGSRVTEGCRTAGENEMSVDFLTPQP